MVLGGYETYDNDNDLIDATNGLLDGIEIETFIGPGVRIVKEKYLVITRFFISYPGLMGQCALLWSTEIKEAVKILKTGKLFIMYLLLFF